MPSLKAEFLVERHVVLADARDVLPQTRIEVILYCVVSAARDHLGDLRPPVSKYSVGLDKLDFFHITPLSFTYGWIEVVVPSNLCFQN